MLLEVEFYVLSNFMIYDTANQFLGNRIKWEWL